MKHAEDLFEKANLAYSTIYAVRSFLKSNDTDGNNVIAYSALESALPHIMDISKALKVECNHDLPF